MCLLQDFGLAGWCSLSVGAGAPRAAPDRAAATPPPISFWFYRVVAGAAEPWEPRGQLRRRRACNTTVRGLRRVLAARFRAGGVVLFIRWRGGAARRAGSSGGHAAADSFLVLSGGGRRGRAMGAKGSASPPAGLQHHGEGSSPCACCKISGWRGGALYPLARGRRAPRRIERRPRRRRFPFWFYRVVAGAAEPWEPRGQLRRRRACNTTVRGLRRVLAARFRAGGVVLFIRWRGGAARRAGSSGGHAAADFFLVLSGGGRRGRAMGAKGSASPPAGLQHHGEGPR